MLEGFSAAALVYSRLLMDKSHKTARHDSCHTTGAVPPGAHRYSTGLPCLQYPSLIYLKFWLVFLRLEFFWVLLSCFTMLSHFKNTRFLRECNVVATLNTTAPSSILHLVVSRHMLRSSFHMFIDSFRCVNLVRRTFTIGGQWFLQLLSLSYHCFFSRMSFLLTALPVRGRRIVFKKPRTGCLINVWTAVQGWAILRKYLLRMFLPDASFKTVAVALGCGKVLPCVRCGCILHSFCHGGILFG
eukprot:scpid23345/ scgid19796/ 